MNKTGYDTMSVFTWIKAGLMKTFLSANIVAYLSLSNPDSLVIYS